MISPQELVEKLEAVTAEDIRAVARDIFTDNRLNIAVIGPTGDESAIKAALRFA